MQWIKASERLPENEKQNYIFRQSGNSRSAKSHWFEHIKGNVEHYLQLPLYNIEWLDETPSRPSPELRDVGAIEDAAREAAAEWEPDLEKVAMDSFIKGVDWTKALSSTPTPQAVPDVPGTGEGETTHS